MLDDAPTEPPSPQLPSLQVILDERFASAIESALKHAIEHASGDAIRRVEAVRRIRKSTKVSRAVLWLTAEAAPVESLSGAQRMLRDISSLLSPVRDRDAMLATIERLLGPHDEPRVRLARSTLTAVVVPSDEDARSREREDLLVQQSSSMLARLSTATQRFRFELVTAEAVVGAMSDAWRTARRLARSEWTTGNSAAAHALRKMCSRLAIQLALVETSAPRSIREIRKGLRSVTSSLGREHDLAMLAERISLERAGFPSDQFVTTAIELCGRARGRMRDEATSSVDRAFALRTKAFRRELFRAVH